MLYVSLRSFQVFSGLLFQINLHLFIALLCKVLHELSISLSKAVPGKFHGSGAHS